MYCPVRSVQSYKCDGDGGEGGNNAHEASNSSGETCSLDPFFISIVDDQNGMGMKLISELQTVESNFSWFQSDSRNG